MDWTGVGRSWSVGAARELWARDSRTHTVNSSTIAVMDRMKPVSLESFRDHVTAKHDERDKGFEAEYQVSTFC